MYYRSVTSRNDKEHENFIKKAIEEGANLIYQIDHDTNEITFINIRRNNDVK